MIDLIKDRLKKQVVGWGKWLGFEVLSKEQTTTFLAKSLVAAHPGDQVILPAVTDFTDDSKRLFDETTAVSEPGYVWHYKSSSNKATLLRCGALFAAGKVLCVDWRGDRRLVSDIAALNKRVVRQTDMLIAPWSHYQDGIRFGGYYDYVVLVAAKLCRVKETLTDDAFRQAAVAYPLFGTAYEQDMLTLLGVGAEQVFDSRRTTVRFNTCLLANSGHWFYPNVADLMALKRQIDRQLPIVPGPRPARRLYISRSGRRRILNEGDLMGLLEKYGIDFIEDKPRTVTEQIELYRSASFVIGPHGASFTNILWCQPGTHLVELFAANYVPDFFSYLAQRLGLRYSGYYRGTESANKFSGLDEDMTVSIPDLERGLNALFATETPA